MSVASWRSRTVPLLLAAATLGAPTNVLAEPPKVPPWHLTFVPASGTPKNCPEEQDVRLSVATRMGYDPFTDDAPRSITVKLVRSAQQVEAHIEARDESGRVVATSKAWTDPWRCDLLGDRAAIFLLDIVDPVVIGPPEEPASPPSTPATPPAPPLAPVPSPPTAASPRAHVGKLSTPPRAGSANSAWVPKLAVFVGGGAAWWSAPETTMSLTMNVEARWTRFTVGFEGRYDLAWSLPTKRAAHGALMGGAALACGYHEFRSSRAYRAYVRACLLGGLARLETGVEGLKVKDGAATVVEIAARFGGGIWLFGPLGVELQVDGAYVAHRPSILLDQREAWRLPSLDVALRLGLVGLFNNL